MRGERHRRRTDATLRGPNVEIYRQVTGTTATPERSTRAHVVEHGDAHGLAMITAEWLEPAEMEPTHALAAEILDSIAIEG
jgi:hypothetical protein